MDDRSNRQHVDQVSDPVEVNLRSNRDTHQTFLLNLNDALRPLADPTRMQETAMRMVAARFNALRALYFEVDLDGDRVTAIEGTENGDLSIPTQFRISDFGEWIAEAMAAGLPITIENRETDPRINEVGRKAFRAQDTVATAAVPLHKDGVFVAAISVSHAEPCAWPEDDLRLLQDVANRTWEAVERARAMAALAASEAQYRLLFESIDEGFVVEDLIYDADGNPIDIEIVEHNRSFPRLSGMFTAVGLRGRDLLDRVEEHWLKTYDTVIKTGVPVRTELFLSSRNRWYGISASRVGGAGSRRLAVVFNDVTERRRAEQRQSLIFELSDAMRQLDSADAIQDVACRMLSEYLDADGTFFCRIDSRREMARIERSYWRADIPKMVGDRPYPLFTPFLDQLERGLSVTVDDVVSSSYVVIGEPAVYTERLVGSFIVMPLARREEAIVSVVIINMGRRVWRASDVALVRDVAERAGFAIERISADFELRRSEERLRLAMDAAELFSWEIDFKSQAISYSPNVERLMGAHPRTPVETLAVVHPDDRDQLADLFSGATIKDDRIDLELRALSPEGGYGWYHLSGSLVHDDSGAAVQAIGTARIVTSQHIAEEALRQSEEKYRRLFETMNEGFCLYEIIRDEQGRAVDILVREANAAFERLTERPNAVGRRLRSIEPDLDEEWLQTLASVVDSGEPGRFTRFSPRTGRWFDVRASVQSESEPPLLSLIFTETTEQVHTEEYLRASEQRYRTIVEQAADYAIFTVDADRRIDSWPAGAMAVFGWTAEEAIGMLMDETFTPEDRETNQPELEFQRTRETGYSPNIRWHIRNDGRRVFIEGSVHIRRAADGTFLGVFKIGQDLTERRRAEEVARENEERQSFLLALSDQLRGPGDPLDVQSTVLRAVGEHFAVDRAFYSEIDLDGGEFWTNRAYEPDSPTILGRFSLSDIPEIARRSQAGETLVISDVATDRQLSDAERALLTEMGVSATIGVPLTRGNSWVATFGVHQYEPREWTSNDVTLIRETAERTWVAVERARAEEALRQSEAHLQQSVTEATAELRTLSHRLLDVQEEERRRLALELHDEIGQVLTALSLQLAGEPVPGPAQIETARAMISTLTEQVQHLSMELRPAILDHFGLIESLRSLCTQVELSTGVVVSFNSEGSDKAISGNGKISVYRIVQEALTNVARHSGARSASVDLDITDQSLQVAISDAGSGFVPAKVRISTGLGGMRERVEILGGQLSIVSSPGKGTTIKAAIDLMPIAAP
jgi:PAS domain S-box-containing protein